MIDTHIEKPEVGMRLESWEGYSSTHYSFSTESFLEIVIGTTTFEEIETGMLGEEKKITKATVTIEKETEKAILVKAEWLSHYSDEPEPDEEDAEIASAWLPKSQVKMEGDSITIPKWLATKNRLVGAGRKFKVITTVEEI